ncbi:hypothetical protein AcetOrient_orf04395 [Acetobacter orientalis]|uniref:Uncharacterized protein n=1 Tax=Acetobacter orientalis TaxID=146474 RepID=A0A2Z5ZLN2_9PROT|nr:hypothetical protein AcetOrient_orf04395 [Acetobacter orientalis]
MPFHVLLKEPITLLGTEELKVRYISALLWSLHDGKAFP